jgi:hypothetical protein
VLEVDGVVVVPNLSRGNRRDVQVDPAVIVQLGEQTLFKNSGACVSYAAHGGTLTEPKSAAQLLCESLGGVFAPGSGNTLWFCTYTWSSAAYNALVDRCFADGGNAFGIVSGNAGGVRMDACTNI